MISTSRRSPVHRVVFGALVAIFLMAFTAPASHAETYQYWSLWAGEDGTWVASSTGASDMKLDNGSVIAAKYVETEESLTAADTPTQSPDYETLCPDSQAPGADAVNVAVVLDYGDASLTPDTATTPQPEVACVSVTKPATGATALSQVSTVSATADGFVTTINGYPNTETATTTEDSDTETEDATGIPALTVILSVAVLGLIVVVAIVMIRRRNDSTE